MEKEEAKSKKGLVASETQPKEKDADMGEGDVRRIERMRLLKKSNEEFEKMVQKREKEHKTAAPARMESYDEFIKCKRVEEGEGENTDNTDSDEGEEPKGKKRGGAHRGLEIPPDDDGWVWLEYGFNEMQAAAEDMQMAIGNMETAAVGLKNGIYWAKKGARILKGTGEEEL